MQDFSYMPYKKKIYLSKGEHFCAPIQYVGEAGDAIQAN